MEDFGYLEKLEDALSKKEQELDKSEIIQFKDALRGFQACAAGILKVLLEKGLIKEDPYHYEQKSSDLKIPPSDPFPESEKQTQISIRFTSYVEQLDFLINFYDLSVPGLSLKRIKTILGLLEYIKWTDFSPNSSQLMTRYVAQLVEKLTQSDDPLAGKVIGSSIALLRERVFEIRKSLKALTDYHKEKYKYDIRHNIMTDLDLTAREILSDPDQLFQKIKVDIVRKGLNLPFYKELIQEIIDEDYSSEGDKLRDQVLDNLKIDNGLIHKKKEDPVVKQRKMLMNCVSGLSLAEPQFELIYSKLRDNSRVMENQKRTFGQKLAFWFSHIFHTSRDFLEYEIKYKDPYTNLIKAETLNFTEFMKGLHQKWGVYKSLADKFSSTYQKVESAPEEQVYEFVINNISDCKTIYKRIIGLDNFFKTNVPHDNRNEIRGLKVESATLKRIIGNWVKDLNEYQAFKEEVEQFKKLGIKVDQ